jgi:hypothetical protein
MSGEVCVYSWHQSQLEFKTLGLYKLQIRDQEGKGVSVCRSNSFGGLEGEGLNIRGAAEDHT